MSKTFNNYVLYHRRLLQKGITENPKHFKKQDLVEFDQVVASARKYLIRENLINSWQPMVYLDKPSQYLTLTEGQIFFKTYLEHESGDHVLLEAISEKVPAKVNAAMQSQIDAIKALRNFYTSKLPADQKAEFDAEVQQKTGKNFEQELSDLENQINGIYGQLEKRKGIGAAIGRGAKRLFGGFQRGMASLFGAGKTKQANLEEQKMMEELFPEYAQASEEANEKAMYEDLFEQVDPTKFSNILDPDQVKNIQQAIQGTLQTARDGGTVLPANVISRLANQFSTSDSAIRGVAHQMVDPLTGRVGGIHVPGMSGAGYRLAQAAATGGKPTATAAIPSATGGVPAATGGSPVATGVAGKAGMGLLGKLGIGAGIAALIAAGAAGWKMRQRRKRIEALVGVAQDFGARIKPPVVIPAVEEPTKQPGGGAAAITAAPTLDQPQGGGGGGGGGAGGVPAVAPVIGVEPTQPQKGTMPAATAPEEKGPEGSIPTIPDEIKNKPFSPVQPQPEPTETKPAEKTPEAKAAEPEEKGPEKTTPKWDQPFSPVKPKAPEKAPDIKLKGKAVMMANNALGKTIDVVKKLQQKNPKVQFLGPEHRKEWEKEIQRMFKTKTLEEAASLLHAVYLMENSDALNHHLMLLEKAKKMGFGASGFKAADKGYIGPGGTVRAGAQSGFTGDAVLDKAFLDQLWNTTSEYWKNKKKKSQRSWDDLAQEMKQQTAAEYTAGDKAKGIEGLKHIEDDELTKQQKGLEGKTDAEKAEMLKQRLKAQKLAGGRKPVEELPLDRAPDLGWTVDREQALKAYNAQQPSAVNPAKSATVAPAAQATPATQPSRIIQTTDGIGGSSEEFGAGARRGESKKFKDPREVQQETEYEFQRNFNEYNSLRSPSDKEAKKREMLNYFTKKPGGPELMKKYGLMNERAYIKAKIRQMVLKELRAMKRR